MTDKPIISLRWRTGAADLYPAQFLPASKTTLRQVRKLLQLDSAAAPGAMEVMTQHIETEIARQHELQLQAGKAHLAARQEVADRDSQLTYGTTPQGLPLTKDAKKQLKEEIRQYKKIADAQMVEYKRHLRLINQLRENNTIIKSWDF